MVGYCYASARHRVSSASIRSGRFHPQSAPPSNSFQFYLVASQQGMRRGTESPRPLIPNIFVDGCNQARELD